MLSNVCLGFFGADASLAHAKAWDLVLWKCPRRFHDPSICFNFLYFHRQVNTFKSPEMCLYSVLRLRYCAGCFHYFKPVSCWILFCENVAGVPRPFDQLPSRVGKVNTFKTSEMRLYFESDFWGGCLTIIFVGSFPYFKFLAKINSKVRRK